jgi:DNA-binding winged helix-turn-helix (wHTH) protein/tetratricopeptide (TPR) repeat protein
MRYAFGCFTIDDSNGQLTYEGRSVDVPHRVFATILTLVKADGVAVSRRALRDAVWGGVHVELNNVSQAVRAARAVLAQGGGADWIVAIPRVGYRFVGPARRALPSRTPRRLTQSPRVNWIEITSNLSAMLLVAIVFGLHATTSSFVGDTAAEARDYLRRSGIFAARRDKDGLLAATSILESGVARFPEAAPLWAELGATKHLTAFYGVGNSREANDDAERYARRALELDPDSSTAHATAGSILLDRDWDLAGAARAFQNALRREDAGARATHWSAWWLLAADRLADARVAVGRAAHAQPFAPAVVTARATFAFFAGDYAQAEADAHHALQLDPNYFRAYLRLGKIGVMRRDPLLAIPNLERAYALAPGIPETVSALGHAYATFGRPSDARRMVSLLSLDGSNAHAYDRAIILTGLQDWSHATAALYEARQDGTLSLGLLKYEPRLRPLRDSGRLDDLLRDRRTRADVFRVLRCAPFIACGGTRTIQRAERHR